MTKTMEYCEFNSAELIRMAMANLTDARVTEEHAECQYCMGEALQQLEQAHQQMIYNKGEAYLPPPPKDPWAWEDPDTFCPA